MDEFSLNVSGKIFSIAFIIHILFVFCLKSRFRIFLSYGIVIQGNLNISSIKIYICIEIDDDDDEGGGFIWHSCPAINVYTADNLDKALDLATRNFCKQEVSMFTEVDEVWISKIFLWYRDDFGGNAVDVIE